MSRLSPEIDAVAVKELPAEIALTAAQPTTT